MEVSQLRHMHAQTEYTRLHMHVCTILKLNNCHAYAYLVHAIIALYMTVYGCTCMCTLCPEYFIFYKGKIGVIHDIVYIHDSIYMYVCEYMYIYI